MCMDCSFCVPVILGRYPNDPIGVNIKGDFDFGDPSRRRRNINKVKFAERNVQHGQAIGRLALGAQTMVTDV